MKRKSKSVNGLVILGIMFLLSAVILAVLATIIWKAEVGSSFVGGGVIAVYVISCFLGGFLMGINMGKHKFFWGLLMGAVYFGILVGAGQLIFHEPMKEGLHLVSSLLICGVAGMLGGMLAPSTASSK